MGRKRGQLSEHERRLWRAVIADVTPLPGKEAPNGATSAEASPASAASTGELPATGGAAPAKSQAKKQMGSQPGSTDASAPMDVPAGAKAGRAVPSAAPQGRRGGGLDRRTAQRFRRGEFPIDARLDLHGYGREAAHKALAHFVEMARARDQRCLLVITGKGKYGGDGILRAAVPEWLKEPALSRHIVATAPARRDHGGDGALYLLLRRNRHDHRGG